MKLDVIYYKKGQWLGGYIAGPMYSWSDYSWSHKSTYIIKDIYTLKTKVNMYLPLKKYVQLYIKDRFMLNDLGVQNFIKLAKEYLSADAIWVNDSTSTVIGYRGNI